MALGFKLTLDVDPGDIREMLDDGMAGSEFIIAVLLLSARVRPPRRSLTVAGSERNLPF